MNQDNTREPEGVLIVNKHDGVTSHDIVNIVRKVYNTKRVGHTGTLDPMATGVLVVLVGRAAKAAEYLLCGSKRYLATLRLGLVTDTEDITGTVLSRSTDIPPVKTVIDACKHFTGKIMQTPPMYSALKVGGRKLYEIARAGGYVEREPRQVEIFSLDCKPSDIPGDFIIDVSCSSGTYIRTLCADIGAYLGCGGVMASLCRLEAGGFDLEDAVTVEQLKELPPEKLEAMLLPAESLFRDLPEIRLPAFFERLCRSGCEIYQSKIGTDFPVGLRVRLSDADGAFFALGEIGKYPNGSAVKAIKFFELE
jgi:tRNA pseudouridine55 synthase